MGIRTLTLLLTLVSLPIVLWASQAEKPVARHYPTQPPAPAWQTPEQAHAKSAGCVSCHTKSDAMTMHHNDAVVLGCVDCHGGDAGVMKPDGTVKDDTAYKAAMARAHVLPEFPVDWNYPSSANPKRSYALLNREAPQYVRFVNPSDYRVVDKACGSCHMAEILETQRSLMSTGTMFWGGASYNNGVLPFKRYILGEAYTRHGQPAAIPPLAAPTDKEKALGVLDELLPLPAWETVKPADIFRVFERGGRVASSQFPEVGIPDESGSIQRLEEPGRPDIKQSIRARGTGSRVAIPVLNMTKTRLNDPMMWFLGTNDQPGDFRSSGCASCHVVYANDRQPKHSAHYAKYGHWGQSVTVDPTISHKEHGHPLRHEFTRAIPTSQCMVCHMHQPNMFLNTYLGYTMWDYEADAPNMWPKKQRYPSAAEIRKVNERNPEGAAPRGLWANIDFMSKLFDKNGRMNDTQFADYHGHGWNFRAVFKRDRKGHLLDAKGHIVSDKDPKKFHKAVHLVSIHMQKGMQCVDCHFSQDAHGNGHIYGEVASAVEITCIDCHGTVDKYPDLRTSGAAAPPGGTDMAALRNPDGRRRFQWINGELIQRSAVDPGLQWTVSLVKDSVNPKSPHYNEKAARAKLMSMDVNSLHFGLDVPAHMRAHQYSKMECYTCHTSWTTSCGGCHLPIQANWKTSRHHYEGGETRNFATYNPQVARTDMFMLGKRGPANDGKIAPTRSSSALVLSSSNANREHIYMQQPPISASGYSSQAFNPHFPHTTRLTETKTCTDCHLSKANDNNAIMAQLLMLGTNYINFVGRYAWVGGDGGITGVQVTEWKEPQAVYGSYLEKYAYPDYYRKHLERHRELPVQYSHAGGRVGCLQMRGEYVYAAEGKNGFRVYDIANIDNKGFSQRITTAPFSPLGQAIHIRTKDATCMALATTQPVAPQRNHGDLMRKVNDEQPMHPIYKYAVITDAKEGLILTNIDTFTDGEFRNNNLKRAVTWNPHGILDGARHITLGGYYAYVSTPEKLVIVNLDDPLKPKVAATLPFHDLRATALQFRYLIVTTADGVEAVDVTHPDKPKKVPNNVVKLDDAHRIYIAREYAYVAAGRQGLAIVDMSDPEKLKLAQLFNANGQLKDTRDVIVGSTNASAFAYVADGEAGLKVLQLTAPDTQPDFYGFNPTPVPQLIAWKKTPYPALALSRGLARDRGVDETGNQVAVFGRLGSRPLDLKEMQKLYLKDDGSPWFVTDAPVGGWKREAVK